MVIRSKARIKPVQKRSAFEERDFFFTETFFKYIHRGINIACTHTKYLLND